jgi:membrane fusion protein, multidrug efflux system
MHGVIVDLKPTSRTTFRMRRMARRAALIVGALVIAGAAAWYAEYWWTTGRFIESTDDAYVGGNSAPMAPHIAGFVAEIAVTDNQLVHAGQLLIRLDDRDVRAAADHAEAILVQRTGALASLRARSTLQQSTIEQAVADLDAKRARAEFAHTDAERYRVLAATNSGTQQNAQRTFSLDQEAVAAVSAAQAGIAAAKQQLEVLHAQIAEAEGAIAQARADLQTARLNLGYAEIRSPIDGYVGNRAAEVGAYVSQGAYLLTIVPEHGLWVDANFKEDQLAQMQPGQSAAIVADTLPGHVFHGHILSLAPATGAVFSVIPPENATGNFTKIVQRVPVRIALDDDDSTLGRIRPGLSTIATVDTRSPSRGSR